LISTPLDPQQAPILNLAEGSSSFSSFLSYRLIETTGSDRHGPYLLDNKGETFIQADARDLSKVKPDTYQTVVSHEFLRFLESSDWEKVLAESFRVVKPGGTVRHAIKLSKKSFETFLRHPKEGLALIQPIIDQSLKGQKFQWALYLDEVDAGTGNLLIVIRKTPVEKGWFGRTSYNEI
jgi:hypothetical protein